MKKLPLFATVALLGLGLAAGSRAEIIPLKLEAGLWEQNSTLLVNGQDMQAKMQQMREQMMARLSPEQRAQMEAHMPKDAMGGKHQTCLSSAQVAKGIDTDKVRQDLTRNHSNCQARLLEATAKGGRYELNCKTPQGGQAHSVGEYTVQSPREWTFHAEGSSDMPGAPAGSPPMKSIIDVHAQWKGSDCGSVKPDEQH